jgi:signal transduction histidine kinase
MMTKTRSIPLSQALPGAENVDSPEQRLDKVTRAMQSLVEGQYERDQLEFLPEREGDSVAQLERAFNQLLRKTRDGEAEGNVAISNLATANVRLTMWNEVVQKTNITDSVLYHGGDIQTFFRQIVVDAMEMARARYGALGVFDKDGKLSQFITEGMSAEDVARIGHPPIGKGLLEVVYCQTAPLRVDDIAADPRGCGFPPGHPPMKTLIGVPLRVGEMVKGVIYLADKQNGTLFGEDDERLPAARFDEDDEGMLTLFGDYLARTMERIDLMALLQKEKAEQHTLIEKLHDAQNQLLQSEKMASIGQLAAGVAHEINNPIGYVNSNLGTLEKYLRDLLAMLEAYQRAEPLLAADPETAARIKALREKLDIEFIKEDIAALMKESEEGVSRVKKIVQDLKDFSHVDESEWQWVDLHKGLESTLNVVWNELKYKAEVLKEYGDLPEVECLPSQLNQVFMNMLVNAAHAIEDRGTITIRTGTEGDEVWVEFADSGKGIPLENLKRIFEPFFTTKPVGKGTGLGLSLSYSIVQKHHGRIDVASGMGRGATFRIHLPVKQPDGKAE